MAIALSPVATTEDVTTKDSGEGYPLVIFLNKYREQLLQCLNPSELIPHLCSEGLLDISEVELLSVNCDKQCKNVKTILALLKDKGADAYTGFVRALEESQTSHLGHAYILSLLHGTVYASEDEICESQRMRENMRKCMSELRERLNIEELSPRLHQERLLTADEFERLRKRNWTSREKVEYFLQILYTKGPKAHLKFVYECLQKEQEHAGHQELFAMLTANLLKRKAADEDYSSVVPVTKRTPNLLESPPGITTKAYLETMKKIRLCHLKGQWDEAEVMVSRWMEPAGGNPIETRIAVLLESCTGFITRQQPDEVHRRVERAREMCSEITTDNHLVLVGRCEWVLAKLYRYSKRNKEAKRCIEEALALLGYCDSSEDKALAYYCHACILLDETSKKSRRTAVTLARAALHCAIDCASRGDYGLDLSHPRLRLAQACLGSSPYQPGQNRDRQSLDEAKASLEMVKLKLASLAPRTKCIYYYTWCDLHLLENQIPLAQECSQQALAIATYNHFETELESSKIRMKQLQQL